jgi:putative N6-adenine-specific DNA methylase
MHWPEFDEREWRLMRDEAHAAMKPGSAVPIYGSDRDAGAIEAATANAARAGVGADIVWARHAVSSIHNTAASGLVATNPPYGKRVQGGTDVRDVYAQFGKVARRVFAGWTVAMYTTEERLARQTRLPLQQQFQTVNGGIRIGAWVGEMPKP